MKQIWKHNEKEFLVQLFSKMGKHDLTWRDDAIIVPIKENMTLLYSIDNAELIYNYKNPVKNMRCYGRWASALVANDIIACGVQPTGIAFDFGIKGKSEEDFMNFTDGVLDVCKYYGMQYEGGNINTTESVSGIAWGITEKKSIIRRDGAQDGDILIITCDLGIGWATKLLENKSIVSEMKDYKEFPVINIELFRKIWDKNVIHCGMDLTDGIVEFAYEITDRTGYGIVLNMDEEKSDYITKASIKLGIPEIALRLDPGYDTPYAHGWCIDPADLEEIVEIFKKFHVEYTIAGYVDATEKGVMLETQGKRISVPKYWDDIVQCRGSIQAWEEVILSLL